MPGKATELKPLFEAAKGLLEPYAAQFTVRRDEPGHYELWSEGDFEIEGRKRKEVFFASLVIRKDYVGFYYMPIYTDAAARDFFGPELLALLKGKSCFYLRELTPTLERQIRDALKAGYELYRDRGWV